MIRIFLPDDFPKNPSITKVYNNLIPRILDSWEDYFDSDEMEVTPPQPLNTRQARETFLKTFLLSKDFYTYSFSVNTPFWSELNCLPRKSSLSSILEETDQSSQKVKDFHTKYSPKTYRPYYEKLRKQWDILQQKNPKSKDPPLSEFKKKFPLNPLQGIFSYDHLTDEERHAILTAMDVSVCPYCNMNYILTYDRDGTPRTTADLDHFYVKYIHPEYALCLYNMVPSCQVCNSRLKGTKDMTVDSHIYPHANSFAGKAEFHVENIVDYLLDQKSAENQPKISLDISPETPADEKDRIHASAGIFRLEPRYQSVPDAAKQLIDKAQIYTDGYNEDLADAFSNAFEGVSIKEMAFGPEETEQEYARHSLGKLRMDLLMQLDIY